MAMPDLMSETFAAEYLRANGFDLQDARRALDWCLSEATGGSVSAQCAAATLLWTGHAGVRDEQQSIYWCKRAADAGAPDAQRAFAAHLISGAGMQPDPATGVAMLTKLIESGHVAAMVTMALLKLSGHMPLVPLDRDGAIDLLLEPAQAGDSYAQCVLGMELLQHKPESAQRAGVQWLLKAAEGGNTTAHEQLSRFYREGEYGLPVNRDLANFHAARARDEFGSSGGSPPDSVN